SSDRRLKRDIKKFEPRPLHRSVPFVSFVLKENGWHGLGSIAQVMQKTAPEHVGDFDWHGKKRLSLNYAGAAYEQAIWAGHELDRQAKLLEKQAKLIAKLEARLANLERAA
ncbi:MAG: tail fiber domain-containing protein, partial [Xanthomonadaceae bacterium]|nr:tail fiber domain-containing protein [Xanthomonadaceae bacterium]